MPTLTYELPGALQEISFAIGKPLSAMKAASELLEKERKRGVKEGIARALLLVLLGCALALLFGWLLCSWAWGKVVLAVLICGSQELPYVNDSMIQCLACSFDMCFQCQWSCYNSSESLNHWHWNCLVIDRPFFNNFCFIALVMFSSSHQQTNA